MPGQWYMPLDPECPDNPVKKFLADPMSSIAPVEDFIPDLEARHRAKCERCREYGAANVDIDY